MKAKEIWHSDDSCALCYGNPCQCKPAKYNYPKCGTETTLDPEYRQLESVCVVCPTCNKGYEVKQGGAQ